MTRRSIEQEAASRETDVRLMEVIVDMAGGDPAAVERIWADPSSEEIAAIHAHTQTVAERGERLAWGAVSLYVDAPADDCIA